MLTVYAFSRRYQEEPQDPADQVQGPLLYQPVHPCPEGFRQGRQAQAVPSPWYVAIAPLRRLVLKFGNLKIKYNFGIWKSDSALNIC
jgi:hypothetical protein